MLAVFSLGLRAHTSPEGKREVMRVWWVLAACDPKTPSMRPQAFTASASSFQWFLKNVLGLFVLGCKNKNQDRTLNTNDKHAETGLDPWREKTRKEAVAQNQVQAAANTQRYYYLSSRGKQGNSKSKSCCLGWTNQHTFRRDPTASGFGRFCLHNNGPHRSPLPHSQKESVQESVL
mmetsp:Transcript_5697/g.13449  ORF Transcript_5697/g.13449 Transcript_5697/m.13449 type:complete len:176 (+) Transcript_5697:2349-2876(+)